MSKRLQVIIDDKEYGLLMRAAKQTGLSLGEWVRQQLRKSLSNRPQRDSAIKMNKLLELSREYSFPSGDIKDINQEIELGYSKK